MTDGTDFLDADAKLSEEDRLVRDTARAFVKREFLPHVVEYWEEGRFPAEIVPRLGELGFLGPTVPVEYGGAGVSKTTYGLIMRELERGDSGLRSFASVQGSLVMYPINEFGSEEQRRRWLPELAAGKAVGCFGLTEPDVGSDPGAMTTRARRDGDDWVLDGAKMWITNGSIADVAVVWARDPDGEILGFLVPKDAKGFSAPFMRNKLSLRASVTSELVLDGVRVPEGNRLPDARGLKAPLMCLTQARYGIAWGAVGAAAACVEEALDYSRERTQFGKPIAAFQLTQEKLADMVTTLVSIDLVVRRLGELADEGRATYDRVSLAKRACVRGAKEVAVTARGILGANGVSADYASMRHMCNLEAVETYEGTYEIHALIVGKSLTGLDAFGG